MLKRTLLVALIVGLTAVGIAKPAKKTRKASAKTQQSSTARVSRKTELRNGKKVRKKVVPYKIQPGDNDWKIAKKTGLSVKELRHLNGGKKLGLIRAGATLNIAKFVAAKPKTAKVSTRSSSRKRITVAKRSTRNKYVASASKRRTAAPKRTVAPKRVITAIKPAPTPVATPATAPTPGPITTVTANMVVQNTGRSTGKGSVDGILKKANTFRGVRYRWGAASRSATDCSGFTSQVFRANGYKIPRTSAEQSKVGTRVDRKNLVPGDLVFFRTIRGTRVSHVGIYVGGNRFIHASSGGGRVMVSSLGDSYYNAKYVGARRVAKGGIITKVVQTAVEAEKTQQVPLDPEPRQSASDVVGN
jgi:cell wall-associated NlpC family hydrolase